MPKANQSLRRPMELIASDEQKKMREPLRLTSETVVMFDGGLNRWGDLPLQDRKAFLNGGYPY